MDYQLTAIGSFQSEVKNKTQAPRQGSLEQIAKGVIVIEKKFQLGLSDLVGFDQIWVIFGFHQNQSWKNLVLPPRSAKKRGVFSTRSPYRPNFLGLSACKLEKIQQNKLYICHADLLDGSPIFDIKPYLAYADSFPKASLGWLKEEQENKYKIKWTANAKRQIGFLKKRIPELEQTIQYQLEYHPTDEQRKRVRNSGDEFIFSYKTWRAVFTIKDKNIQIQNLQSGYHADDFLKFKTTGFDPYQDMNLHLDFLKFLNL